MAEMLRIWQNDLKMALWNQRKSKIDFAERFNDMAPLYRKVSRRDEGAITHAYLI